MPIPAGFKQQELSLDDLHPAPYNRRDLDPEAELNLTRILRRFDLVQPLIINRRTTEKGHDEELLIIVSGHQRARILRGLGKTTAICWVAELTLPEEMTLNHALNNPKAQGTWQEGAIQDFVKELDQTGGRDLLLSSGYNQAQLEDIIQWKPGDLEDLEDPLQSGGGGERRPPTQHACPSCGFEFLPSKDSAVKERSSSKVRGST